MRAEMELVRALWVTRAAMHAVCEVGGAHQLIEQIANLALRQVMPRTQHTTNDSARGPQLALEHAAWQHARMELAAARARPL